MVDFIGQLYGNALGGQTGPLAVDIWREIVRFAEKDFLSGAEKNISYEALTFEFLNDLKTIPSGNWLDTIQGIGHNIYGAVALSWCQGATLDQVWAGWLASGFPLKPLPEYERPARFINPALLPQRNKLNDVLAFVNAQNYPDAATYDLAFCAIITALKEPLDFDLTPEKYQAVRPQIAAFLKAAMLKKSAHNPQEKALIETWSTTIKDSEFDIWEGA